MELPFLNSCRRSFTGRPTTGYVLAIAVLTAASFVIVGCGGRSNDPPANANTGTNANNGGSDRGREIIDEYLKRDAAPFRKTHFRITVSQEGEATTVFELNSMRKQTDSDTSTLTQILAPPEDSDTSSLTLESPGKKTVVVTYSQALDTYRETDTRKMFFGGLTAGELLGEWDKYDYHFVGERSIDGATVDEVEGKIKSGSDSVVARLVADFRADNFVPVEMHAFGADGKEIRVYHTTKIKDDPVHPYAERIEVDNPVYKAHIVIEVVSREFPATIDDSMFTREKLKPASKK